MHSHIGIDIYQEGLTILSPLSPDIYKVYEERVQLSKQYLKC